MARMGKAELERYGGARWAIEKVRSLGLEEAEKEFAWRGVMNAPLNIEKAEIRRFENELKENVKRTMGAMACMVLRDEFGFGHDRLEKFLARWNLKVDCLVGDYCTWEDFATVLKEETGIDVDVTVEYKHRSEWAGE